MRQINRKKSKQEVNNMYTSVHMGESQKTWVTHQNGWNPHLKCHLQLETKEDVVGSGLGIQSGGRWFTRRWKSKCLEFPWPHLAHIFFLVSLVALFLGQPLYLNYSTVKKVVKRKTLSLFFLKSTLPNVILLTKRHILGWQILLPYNTLDQVEKVNMETQGGSHLLPKIVPKVWGGLA